MFPVRKSQRDLSKRFCSYLNTDGFNTLCGREVVQQPEYEINFQGFAHASRFAFELYSIRGRQTTAGSWYTDTFYPFYSVFTNFVSTGLHYIYIIMSFENKWALIRMYIYIYFFFYFKKINCVGPFSFQMLRDMKRYIFFLIS